MFWAMSTGVTDGGERANATWAQMWGPFLEIGPPFGFVFFLNNFINLVLLFIQICFCYTAAVPWKALRKSFFKRYFHCLECQWKVTALTVVPSLVEETLSWLLIASWKSKRQVTMRKKRMESWISQYCMI